MSEIQDIEVFTMNEFSDLLVRYGFGSPQVTREAAKTRIDYLKEDFAIEVELDWRDFIAFVLLVRLEDGQLPAGYYVSQGKKCRKHLGRVIQEQGWKTPEGPHFDQGLSNPANGSDLKAILLRYKEQLSGCVEKLVDVGASAF